MQIAKLRRWRRPDSPLPVNLQAVTWAFGTGSCGSENWGGYSAQQLVDFNKARWVAAGKKYIVSTGGGTGPAFLCNSDAGFATFLQRYMSSSLIGVDFDIETTQPMPGGVFIFHAFCPLCA